MNRISKYLKQATKRQLEDRLDVKIYSNHAHGREDWFDIKATGCDVTTIFDVGANVGQSAIKFRKAFPESRIYCFEPVETVFRELTDRLTGDDRVSLHEMALADSPGKRVIHVTADPTTHSLCPCEAVDSAEVAVSTVDEFAEHHALDRIDLLKIDVEGYDLKVLQGAANSLQSSRIGFVIVEVKFNEDDSVHVSFEDVREFLAPYGYSVFGIYDQQLEWSGQLRLRFANACFCSEKAIVKK